ncbi:MAG: hypothetical protein ACREXP_18495, partial [Steroidobacteraceae bacterium]
MLTEDLGNGLKITSGFNSLTGLLESRQSGVGGGTGIQNLSYQWSNNGNLTRRQDLRQSLTEVFTYDPLERLHAIPTLHRNADGIGWPIHAANQRRARGHLLRHQGSPRLYELKENRCRIGNRLLVGHTTH